MGFCKPTVPSKFRDCYESDGEPLKANPDIVGTGVRYLALIANMYPLMMS
jgi:hypothetical protein